MSYRVTGPSNRLTSHNSQQVDNLLFKLIFNFITNDHTSVITACLWWKWMTTGTIVVISLPLLKHILKLLFLVLLLYFLYQLSIHNSYIFYRPFNEVNLPTNRTFRGAENRQTMFEHSLYDTDFGRVAVLLQTISTERTTTPASAIPARQTRPTTRPGPSQTMSHVMSGELCHNNDWTISVIRAHIARLEKEREKCQLITSFNNNMYNKIFECTLLRETASPLWTTFILNIWL